MPVQLRNASLIEMLRAEFLTRDAWQTWTPTVTQNVGVACTANYARYAVLAGTVLLRAKLTVNPGAAGTGNNVIVVGGIPAALAIASPAAHTCIGSGLIDDGTVAHYIAIVEAATASTLKFIGASSTDYIGKHPNFALAAGDVISFTVSYERA